jgi:glycosyltransferase involved in cell wall biosynthesis
MLNPFVSICCLTYNHEPFIRQCLDGFIMQKTDFPIEVLIHDDASTDGTADIIREYEKKYPEIIKPIFQTENKYSKGIKISQTYNYPRAQGKYIALCEGDDYWTDPYKLQKQVDILENNNNIACVYTNFQTIDIFSENIDFIPAITYHKHSKSGDIFIDLLNGNFILTLTVCFRKADLPQFYYEIKKPFDYSLFLSLANEKEFYYLNDITGCYRINPNGMVQSQKEHLRYLKIETSIYIMYLFLKKRIRRKSLYKNCIILFIIFNFIFAQGIIHHNKGAMKLLLYSWKLRCLFILLFPFYTLYKIAKKYCINKIIEEEYLV